MSDNDKTNKEVSADTEVRILRAAEEEFLSKGFDGARTTTIAEKAGVTHAMLHYYYRTKENLFERMLADKIGDISEIMLGSICQEMLPLREKIRRGVENHFDFVARNPEMPFFLLTEMRRNPDRVRSIIESQQGRAAVLLTSLQRDIDDAAARGECRDMDAMMLMLDIVSLNLMTFLINPVAGILFDGRMDDRETYLNARREEIVNTVSLRIFFH